MKMCLEVLKVERKNRTEVHVYAHDQFQANLSVGWLVCACITIFHEVITIFFFAVLCRPNTFWSMYPGTVWCTQMLRNAILQKKKKEKNIAISIRTSTTAAKVVIFLVKLRFLFPLLRAIRCPRHETGSGKKGSRIWNDRAKLHDLALDPMHSWLLPTKRLFRSAANFDFHDNRPKMADLKSVYTEYFHSLENIFTV